MVWKRSERKHLWPLWTSVFEQRAGLITPTVWDLWCSFEIIPRCLNALKEKVGEARSDNGFMWNPHPFTHLGSCGQASGSTTLLWDTPTRAWIPGTLQHLILELKKLLRLKVFKKPTGIQQRFFPSSLDYMTWMTENLHRRTWLQPNQVGINQWKCYSPNLNNSGRQASAQTTFWHTNGSILSAASISSCSNLEVSE